MPVQHAVLALLVDGDSYGYELRTRFEEAVGPQWGEISIGHLYQVLDRLVREKQVTKRNVRQTDRPDRVVYRLTAPGRAELDRWLATPFVRQSGYRDDFFLKLLAASRLGKPVLQRVITTQRKAYTEELRALSCLRREHDHDPVVGLLIEAAILHTEANLRTIDLASTALPELTRRSAETGEMSRARRLAG